MNIINLLEDVWYPRDAASLRLIRDLENEMRISLPSDYIKIMRCSNGGEGRIGKHYLSLWSIGRIMKLNSDYEVGSYLPGIVGIGTDGGGYLYAYDYRSTSSDPPFVRVPLGDLCVESIVQYGTSLETWLRANLPES